MKNKKHKPASGSASSSATDRKLRNEDRNICRKEWKESEREKKAEQEHIN